MFGQSYPRLRTLATAWATPGTSLTGSPEVADALVAALSFLGTTGYNPARGESGNWWFWEIGAPRALMDTCVLMRSKLPAADLAGYVATVAKFCPNPDRRTNSPSLSETGANRADKAVIVALRGLLARDAATVALARDGLSDVRDNGRRSLFTYVTSGDGFYEDGSFVQHDSVAYTGTYGSVLLGSAGQLIALLAGSDWAVNDPKVSVLYEAVERSFSPVMFDGLMMDALRGRAISRERARDYNDGAVTLTYILQLAAAPWPRTPTAGVRSPRGGSAVTRPIRTRVSSASRLWRAQRPSSTTRRSRRQSVSPVTSRSPTWTAWCTGAPAGRSPCRSPRSASPRTKRATVRTCTAGTPATA